MRKDARQERTLSGELRRAVHQSDFSLEEIATRIGITPIMLDDFLTGERTLRSDILGRLADCLKYQPTEPNRVGTKLPSLGRCCVRVRRGQGSSMAAQPSLATAGRT